MKKVIRRPECKVLLLLILPVLLAGCSDDGTWLWILNPNGALASASIYYLIVQVLLLGVVIVPATALVIWAFFRYRRGGPGHYNPHFNHSLTIEIIVWGGSILLVGVMSYFSVEGSFAVGPYNPGAVNAAAANSINHNNPLKINVISTDWQWLFVYPQLHIAIANRLVVPARRKVEMQLTSVDITNDFYVLEVINQIYLMPGMRTRHNVYFDRPGTYRGFSTEFSGQGFSWMNYKMKVVTAKQFQKWIARAKAAPQQMSWQRFKNFAKPTVNTAGSWALYSDVAPNLFTEVIKQVRSGQLTYQTPMGFTEDMHSRVFKQHSTGKPQRGNS